MSQQNKMRNKEERFWQEVELGKVAKFINGRAFRPSEWENEGKIIIRIQDLTGSITNPNYTSQEFDKKYLVKKGDLLISWSATLDAFLWDKGDGWLNQHIFKVKEDKKLLNHKYLFYFVKKSIDLFKRDTHGSTMKHITKGNFGSIKVPLPPLETQEKIVSILEKAEALKQKREQADKLTDEYLKSIFSEMFLNKGIYEKKLMDVCIKITDGAHVTPKYTERGIPFLRVTDLTESNNSKKFISKEEHKDLIKRCKPEKGDLLYTKNGTIGVAKTINWDYEFSIFVSLCLIKPNRDILIPKYLEFFLNTPYALRQAMSHSKKGTITNLHLIEIKKIKIPLPPIELQKKFASIVENVEKLKEKQKKSKEYINEMFNSLMQKAFKGELIK